MAAGLNHGSCLTIYSEVLFSLLACYLQHLCQHDPDSFQMCLFLYVCLFPCHSERQKLSAYSQSAGGELQSAAVRPSAPGPESDTVAAEDGGA